MAEEKEKVFLSDEHKEFLIKPQQDEAFKRQLLDSVDYLARHMPSCEKESIKEAIKTSTNRIWAVLIIIIGALITVPVVSCNGMSKKIEKKIEQTMNYGRS